MGGGLYMLHEQYMGFRREILDSTFNFSKIVNNQYRNTAEIDLQTLSAQKSFLKMNIILGTNFANKGQNNQIYISVNILSRGAVAALSYLDLSRVRLRLRDGII